MLILNHNFDWFVSTQNKFPFSSRLRGNIHISGLPPLPPPPPPPPPCSYKDQLLEVLILNHNFDWFVSTQNKFPFSSRLRGNIHISGLPPLPPPPPPPYTHTHLNRQLACCMHGRSHTRSPGVSIMRVDSWELPLSGIPFCQLLPCHLGPPRPMLSINLYVTGCFTAQLEYSMCLYQQSLLSFRMRSRSSMPSYPSSSLDLMVTMSCSLTLQICLIIALSFLCRHWRFGFVNGQVSLAWSIALPTQALYTWPCVLKERW